MRWTIPVLGAGIVILAAIAVLSVIRGRELAPCRVADPDRRIAGCTAFIKAHTGGKDLATAYYNRGVAYHEKRDYDRAIADYDQAIRLRPGYVAAFGNRGAAYADKGQYGRAIQDYDQAISFDPNDFRHFYNRGEAYLREFQSGRAIESFSQAIKLNPNFAPAFTDRGQAYNAERQYDRAITDESKAIELNPKSALAFSNRGAAYYGKGQYDRALEDFDRALKLDPTNAAVARGRRFAEAATQRAVALPARAPIARTLDKNWARCKSNDLTARIAGCAAIIDAGKETPTNLAIAYDNRGIAYYGNGEYDRAIPDFDQAIKLSANDPALFLHRGAAYRQWYANDRAIEDFTQAVALDPAFADAFASRGNVYYRKRQYDRVIADESKAIELNPKSAFAFVVRGLAYADRAEYDRAIEDYSRGIKLDPNRPRAYTDRAVAYVAKGQYDRAVKDYDRALKLDPQNAAAARNRRLVAAANQHTNSTGDGGAAAAEGREDVWALCAAYDLNLKIAGCTAFLRSFHGSSQDAAKAFDRRGTAYQFHGQRDRAMADFDQAIKLSPRMGDAFFHRGFLYHQMQQYDRAIADYDRALALKPNDTGVLLYRARLYAAEGQYKRAMDDYDQIRRIYPNDATARADANKLRLRMAALPPDKVAAEFSRSAPGWFSALRTAPAETVAQSYFSEKYTIRSIHQFAEAGALVHVDLNGRPQAITKENADAYVKGYTGALALHDRAIRARGFRQVAGNFAMKVGPNCRQRGFNDGAVSIAQNEYHLKLEKGWPAQYEGLIIEDTIAIGAPDNTIPNVIGRGRARAGLIEISFGNCSVTLTPP